MPSHEPLRARFASAATAVQTRLPLFRKAATFGLVGLVNTGIDFAIFWTAVQKFGVALVPANVLAWLVAVSGSYVMNSFITFAAESGRKLRWRDYATFVASGIAGVIANTTTLVVIAWLAPAVFADKDHQLIAAKICAILVSFVVNFSLSHFVVFRTRPRAAKESR